MKPLSRKINSFTYAIEKSAVHEGFNILNSWNLCYVMVMSFGVMVKRSDETLSNKI